MLEIFFMKYSIFLILWTFLFNSPNSVTLWCYITVWKLLNFTATNFSQKFRESTGLLKNFTLNWFDEKNLHGSEFFVFPHCAQCGKTKNLVSPRKYPKKFRQIWWKNSLLLFSNFSVIQFHELWQIKEEKKSFWDAFSSFSSYSYYLCHRNFLTLPLWYFFTSSISNKGPITNSFES